MQAADMVSVSSEWVINNAASVAVAIVILILGLMASRFAARWVHSYLPRARGMDETIAPLLAQTAKYAVLLIAILLALGQVGVHTTSMLAVLGAAGLAIALALQGTLSNVAAGVMMIWLRPMSIGEYIDGQGIAGTVVEIGLFGTRLRTADGVFLFCPNSQLWAAAITNYSREPRRRLDLRVGIAYDADIAKARKAMMKIANGDKRVLPDPPAVVYLDDLGNSSVVMLLRIWVATSDYWDVKFQFTEDIKLAFDKDGIEIPFNKLDVNILKGTEQQTTGG